MPTSYTAGIADGISFEEYVWRCARAMGALLPLRDEPFTTPVPEKFEVNSYYADEASEAAEELQRLASMTTAEITAACQRDFEKRTARIAEWQASSIELRQKYSDMLEKAKAWQPPTPDHRGFQEFMIKQIEDSIEWDCRDYSDETPAKTSPQEWFRDELQDARSQLERYNEEHRKEVERTNSRNKWIADLRASLASK